MQKSHEERTRRRTSRSPRVAVLGACAAVVAMAGCGTSGSGAGGHTTTATGTSGTSTASGTSTGKGSTGATTSSGTGGAACVPSMKYGGGEMTVSTGYTVKAKVVDETGAVVPSQPIYICGIDICSDPSKTGADGSAAITTALPMKKAAFKYGDTVAYAEFAIPLTTMANDFTLGGTAVIGTGKLSDKTGAALTPGTSATSGDVTIAVPTGASVGVDGLVYTTPDSQKLRTVNVPLANMGPVLNGVMAGGAPANFKLLYGVSPAETLICPGAKVTVALPNKVQMPNDFGWAPGAAVEFWIMTVDVGQVYAPYAGWAKASDGTVSPDGASVSTVDGQGFIDLENFAIRLKQ